MIRVKNLQTRASRPRAPPVRAVANAVALKTELKALVGDKAGLDKTEDEKRAIVEFAERLRPLSPPKPAEKDLGGTSWKLLFTNSQGQSAGKVGPFVGSTLQVFPADKPGEYVNSLSFANGFVRILLQGVYEAGADDKIDLEFKDVSLRLGDVQVLKRDFPPNFKGFWRCIYVDDDLRVFYTNKDNLFILRKEAGSGVTYDNWSRFDPKTFG